MNAGELNHKITIQKRSVIKDADGYEVEAWSDLCNYWASANEMGSKELYYAQKTFAESTAVFVLRYTQRVTMKMRVKYDNKLYEIIGLTPDGKRTELRISAREIV